MRCFLLSIAIIFQALRNLKAIVEEMRLVKALPVVLLVFLVYDTTAQEIIQEQEVLVKQIT